MLPYTLTLSYSYIYSILHNHWSPSRYLWPCCFDGTFKCCAESR